MITPVNVERPRIANGCSSRQVNPDEFLKYALSHTRWERTSGPESGLVGLMRPDGNDCVFVDSAELDRFRLLPR